MTDEQIEKFAIRVALGNNGGTWSTHYTEDQKDHWRKFVRDLELEMHADKQTLALIKSSEPISARVANILNRGFESHNQDANAEK